MDIEYLLILQELRERAPEWFNCTVQFITDAAGGLFIILIPMIVFFCIDKKKGEFIWISLSVSSVIIVFIKNLLCVYRPWIRSDLIKPAADAIEGAGDYSFPSSHTQGSASSFGSLAYVYRKKKLLSVICVCIVLAVAFSRNYLGVHTPQDVLTGMIIAVAGMILAHNIQKTVGDSEKKRFVVYLISVVITAAALIYVTMKKYPVDYDAMGNILYDPSKSVSSFAAKAGLMTGFLTAWILEEKYIDFTTDDLGIMQRIMRAAVGIVLFFASALLASIVSSIIPITWLAAFAQNSIMYFCIIFFVPLVFTKIESFSRGR